MAEPTAATPTAAPKPLTIILTGGGSGGHITPILAVAKALKQQRPNCHIVYVALKGDKLGDLVTTGQGIDEVRLITGGKWRRYHGEGWRQIFDIATLAKNIRDFFRVLWGTLQSLRLLGKIKPDGVFIKGAYVGVPIGWAARLRRIPYVTLDLDATPSLANRLIAKQAAAHAVGMPKELYSYPPDRTFFVGVPIAKEFTLVTPQQQAQFKSALKLDNFQQVILASGGGLGANRLNIMLANQLPAILAQYPDAALVHSVGRDHEEKMNDLYDKLLDSKQRQQVMVKGYIEDMYRYSGAADLVIGRAGATSLAELAAQGKACVIVPNPQLTGGHQLKNADQLAAHGAIKVVHESEQGGEELRQNILDLLGSETERVRLGTTLHSLAQPEAATRLAELLIQTFTPNNHATSA